ncbi:hypothetical protein LIER_22434 [Lithospermum erythrorhizon]|uniref:Uncharacterized protein n=1 Tax=Lithospermum erythrorhizon TaxID=34254 RepID=A0AAV3QW67_LITER
MPGVDKEIALHKLHEDPSFKPVKQKKRNFSDDKNRAIQKEVEELHSKSCSYIWGPLTRPEEGEEIQLNLVVLKGAVSSVLLREEQGAQRPIYYVRIKAQVLADFIVENSTHSVSEAPSQEKALEEAPKWILYVDRENNHRGAGAGILIQGVNGEQFEYAL